MAIRKVVGQVTIEERNEIQQLFERRNGLNELAKILTADNHELYEKLVKDMGETGTKFQSWWDRMGEKYQWESIEGGNWEINFETCEIYLVGGAYDGKPFVNDRNIRTVAYRSLGTSALWWKEIARDDEGLGTRGAQLQGRNERSDRT